MALRSRLASLTATTALAVPAAALIAVLPGTAAQAAPACSAQQATITFVNGSTHCQSFGIMTYSASTDSGKVAQICAGDMTAAEVWPTGATALAAFPGMCEQVRSTFDEIAVAVVPV